MVGIVTHFVGTMSPGWWLGVALSFAAGVCESAKPRARDDAEPADNGLFGGVAALAALLATFALFLDGFWRLIGDDRRVFSIMDMIGHAMLRLTAVLSLFVALAAVTTGAGIVGWVIARSAPRPARVLYQCAPTLSLATLLLVAGVTYPSVARVLEAFFAH